MIWTNKQPICKHSSSTHVGSSHQMDLLLKLPVKLIMIYVFLLFKPIRKCLGKVLHGWCTHFWCSYGYWVFICIHILPCWVRSLNHVYFWRWCSWSCLYAKEIQALRQSVVLVPANVIIWHLKWHSHVLLSGTMAGLFYVEYSESLCCRALGCFSKHDVCFIKPHDVSRETTSRATLWNNVSLHLTQQWFTTMALNMDWFWTHLCCRHQF